MKYLNGYGRWLGGIVLTTLLAVWACTSEIVPATGRKQFLGFSWEQEREIGKQAAQEIGAAFGVYKDAKLQAYVERVGQRVLKESHLRGAQADEEIAKTPITFQILDSPTVNAMAIPGGHIYVTRGLLAHLTSEDQLAFVLGHEIGHVSARHAARRTWQQQLGQGLLMGGAILGQVMGLPAEQILQLGGTAAQLIFLRHSRGDELESDSLAVNYTKRAGYDPLAVRGFFRSLSQIQEKEGAALPNFLSTHPDPGNRVERITELTGGTSAKSASEAIQPEYLAAIDGIVLGEDPRQGFVENGQFYHPELRFRFPVPRGFKVINQAAQVAMIEGQQRAVVGFTAVRERSAEAAANAFFKQSGLRVRETFKSRSGSLPGVGAIADAQSQDGQVVRLIAYFAEHRNQVYHFIAYSAPQTFGQYQNEFLRVMSGFGELTDPEILRRQPVRLDVARAPRSAPFRNLIPTKLPGELRAEDIAIMNQVALNQQIEQGRPIKLPRMTG